MKPLAEAGAEGEVVSEVILGERGGGGGGGGGGGDRGRGGWRRKTQKKTLGEEQCSSVLKDS